MATFSISTELVVTLKYYYIKNISVVSRNHDEPPSLFEVPWGRINTSLKVTVRGSHPE